MIEKYRNNQILFYNYFKKAISNNKISHAYLIETNNVSYSKQLAIDLAKFFLTYKTDEAYLNKTSSDIDNNNYPDIRIIDAEKIIKKDDIVNLQIDFMNKPVYGDYLIYIITDVSKFNISSSNTILKFLEEPSDNIIAILLVDNIYKVLDTISSRCQIISLSPEQESIDSILNSSFNVDYDISLFIANSFSFYYAIVKNKSFIFTNDLIYSFKDNLQTLFKFGLFLFYDCLNIKLEKKVLYFCEYKEKLNEFVMILNTTKILKYIDVINDFLTKSVYNVNKDLFIDNFIISMIGDDVND